MGVVLYSPFTKTAVRPSLRGPLRGACVGLAWGRVWHVWQQSASLCAAPALSPSLRGPLRGACVGLAWGRVWQSVTAALTKKTKEGCWNGSRLMN